MMKIIIAEDQVLIQKDICKKIEKTQKNVTIVSTALNGKDAYEKILEFKPDILITDIRMPIQSGLSLIRQLKDEHIPIKTVILSGYKDFEYAKEAIQLGVDEYLLKPISVEDLKYILDTLEEKILSQRTCEMENALHAMLSFGKPFPKNIQSTLSFHNYYFMMLNFDSYASFSLKEWLPFENELEDILKGPIIQKYIKKEERFFIYNGSSYNQKLLIFCLNRNAVEKLNMMASELTKHLERLTSSVTICMSSEAKNINDLNIEYQLMKNQLGNRLIFSHSSILYIDDFLKNVHPTILKLDSTIADDFQFCIHTQNLNRLFDTLHDFLDTCYQKQLTQKQLSIYLKSLLHICFDNNGKNNLSNKELEIDEYLSNSKTYDELELSLHLLLQQLFQKHILKQGAVSNSETLIEDVKKYIAINYGKDININDIATHFSITPAYLSRLFKKYTGVRPIEYLTNYRIHQACNYFSNSQLTVREVAELCGYSNQFYFSKTFKQIISISPSEYRIQHQASENE